MPSDAHKLHHWLQGLSPFLQEIFSRTERLTEINRVVREWLAEPWATDIRVANLRGDTLVVYSTNAAALTLFRYRSPALLDHLRERMGLSCTKIEAKVRPEPGHLRPESKR